MSQQAAKRRRTQAAMGYTHMSPTARPHYKKRSAATLAARLAKSIETERRMQQTKGKKK